MSSWFPINFELLRGIPINAHPGAFGCARKYNFHEGIDLYGKEGDWVHAINDGVVVLNRQFTGPEVGHDWWLPTDALLIKSETEYFCYGELKSHLKVGDTVKSGERIGDLVPVLTEDKIRSDIPGHSNVMLHLEKYSLDYNPDNGWSCWQTWDTRPSYLLDPTVELIDTLKRKHKFYKLLTY